MLASGTDRAYRHIEQVTSNHIVPVCVCVFCVCVCVFVCFCLCVPGTDCVVITQTKRATQDEPGACVVLNLKVPGNCTHTQTHTETIAHQTVCDKLERVRQLRTRTHAHTHRNNRSPPFKPPFNCGPGRRTALFLD